MSRKVLAAAFLLATCCVHHVAHAQSQFPLWERLLSTYGGKSDTTTVPSMKMGAHMQMSMPGKSGSGDQQRADEIVAAARRVTEHYADVNTALADGYRPFFPTGKMGEEVHYANARFTKAENDRTDYDHPGSLLYKRTPQGMKIVGVMYTAPQNATPADLDAVAPLSIATFHRHVDFCGAPSVVPLRDQFGPHSKFGFNGSIDSQNACMDAGGLWIPVVFGWMTHVYPDGKDGHVWAGMDMHLDESHPEKM